MIKDQIKAYGEEITSGTADSILSSVFRSILKDLKIGGERFNTLIHKYIVRANIPMNLKEVSSVRGNLKKELLKSAMTWKVFVKGISFLNVWKFEFTIRLYHMNGMVTDHSKTVVLDTVDQEIMENIQPKPSEVTPQETNK